MYTPPNSDDVRKPKGKTHFVIQLDYMIVYTHTFFLFVSNIHVHLFSVFGLGNI